MKRISLHPDLDRELKKISHHIYRKRKSFEKPTKVGELGFKNDAGVKGIVKIYVDRNYIYSGVLEGDDISDLKIILDPNSDKQSIYHTLYHEMLHATDPEWFDEGYWEDYDPETEKQYYGHDIEFRAFTNEFFNALVDVFNKKIKESKNKKDLYVLKNSLTNIVNYFANNETLTDFSSDLIDSSFGRFKETGNEFLDLIRKIQMDYPSEYTLTTKSSKKEALPSFINSYINKIKEYNPNRWNDFIRSLYTTYEEILSKIHI